MIAAESEAGWSGFFKGLKERGLSGVELVISDAHQGLVAAVRKVWKAEWQRCKVHFYWNVLVHVPKRSQADVSEAMKSVFVQRDGKRPEQGGGGGEAVSGALRQSHGGLRKRH